MSAVTVEHLSVVLAERTVLRDISFTVGQGETVSILGANGCGKSTLLRSILGLQPITAGDVRIDERQMTEYTPAELAPKVAFLPQSADIDGDMTVEEWVACGRYPYQRWWNGVSDTDRAVIQQALEQTNILHLRHRWVTSLSGGERQRARIAMALAQEPEIIMLDEPTTYLDLAHQLEVMELLRRINVEEQVSVVMVLHDVNHAAKYSDWLLVLADAQVFANGSPQEILTADLMKAIYGVDATIECRDGYPYCFIHGLTASAAK